MRKISERLFKQVSVSASTLMLMACGQNFQSTHTLAVNANSIDIVSGEGATSGDSNRLISNAPATGASTDTGATFCSQLSFSGVTWDQSLSINSRRAFAIALSISGGFEGGDGWANLTNNFDGTGLSAGLLNQTLGTGSLQPLLSTMKSQHASEFGASMTTAHNTALSSMLTAWQKSTSWKPAQTLQLSSVGAEGALSVPSESVVSLNSELASSVTEPLVFTPLDIGFQILSTATTNSVTWAVQNLYQSSGSFVASWKTDLQKLLRVPNYVTIQINTALKYHLLAQKYMARVGYNDLRTYLLMFDIVTQNGSISEARFAQWEQQVASQKITGEGARLKALVEVRLLDTLSQWRADVRSRKYALIDGAGTVHGSNLNLTKKYCYGLSDAAK